MLLSFYIFQWKHMRKTEKCYSHKWCIPIVHRNVCLCCSCIVKWCSSRAGNRVLNKRMRKEKQIPHITGKTRVMLITFMIAGQGLVYERFGQITLSHIKWNFIMLLLMVAWQLLGGHFKDFHFAKHHQRCGSSPESFWEIPFLEQNTVWSMVVEFAHWDARLPLAAAVQYQCQTEQTLSRTS